MTELSTIMLGVTAAAILCALLRALPIEGGLGKLMQVLCGLFMLVTLFSGFTGGVRFDELNFSQLDAHSIVQDAKLESVLTLREIIITETEAYILDKANKFGAELTVEVSVDDSELPTPCAVTVRGSVSPYARQQLQQIIADDLGICVEDQRWIG